MLFHRMMGPGFATKQIFFNQSVFWPARSLLGNKKQNLHVGSAIEMNYDMGISLVSIDSNKSDLFPVNVGLWQRCPLSLVLFIVSMDRISWRCQGTEGPWFGDHRTSLVFADDVVLLGPVPPAWIWAEGNLSSLRGWSAPVPGWGLLGSWGAWDWDADWSGVRFHVSYTDSRCTWYVHELKKDATHMSLPNQSPRLIKSDWFQSFESN